MLCFVVCILLQLCQTADRSLAPEVSNGLLRLRSQLARGAAPDSVATTASSAFEHLEYAPLVNARAHQLVRLHAHGSIRTP